MRYEEFLNTVNNAIKLIDKLDEMIQTQPDEVRKELEACSWWIE